MKTHKVQKGSFDSWWPYIAIYKSGPGKGQVAGSYNTLASAKRHEADRNTEIMKVRVYEKK